MPYRFFHTGGGMNDARIYDQPMAEKPFCDRRWKQISMKKNDLKAGNKSPAQVQ